MRANPRKNKKEDREGSALIYNNTTTTTTNNRLITLTIEHLVVLFKIIRIHKMMRLFKCFTFNPLFIKYHNIIMNLKLRFSNSSKTEYKSN